MCSRLRSFSGQVFAYKDYRQALKQDQLLIGIRQGGSPRIGSFQDFKILLILGGSSSGKTTTTLEKCLGVVTDNGQLIVCDPGGFKPDSLTQRMGPLKAALLPGTSIALEHDEIMRNVECFRQELERRRRGASMHTPILLVIDELNGILMDKEIKKELTELIEKFAQQARGYNLYMILCAQRASGLAAIRNSVISFICHKCPEMESSKILPARYARLTPQLGVGQTFVSDADGFIEPLQQPLITKDDLAESASAILHARQTSLRRSDPVPPAAAGSPPATTKKRAPAGSPSSATTKQAPVPPISSARAGDAIPRREMTPTQHRSPQKAPRQTASRLSQTTGATPGGAPKRASPSALSSVDSKQPIRTPGTQGISAGAASRMETELVPEAEMERLLAHERIAHQQPQANLLPASIPPSPETTHQTNAVQQKLDALAQQRKAKRKS